MLDDDDDDDDPDRDRVLALGQGTFELVRPDAGPRAPVRAWDAADELVMDHLLRTGRPGTGSRTVVVNDAWGALATALADDPLTWMSDSYVARRSLEENLARNGRDPSLVRTITPVDTLSDGIDTLLVKVPKALALLEHELALVAPHLHDGSHVVGAGMTRHIHRSTLVAFEQAVGPTRTSLAHRKARLVHATVDPPPHPRPTDRGWPRTDRIDELDLDVVSHAGLFSAGRLDPGTRLLLAHLPPPGSVETAADLGCGTGIVGTVLARADADLHVTFVDESRLAVASAAATVQSALGDAEAGRRSRSVWGDGLDDLDEGPPIGDGTLDLVVVNPPFHRDHSIGDATAWRMFRQARRALRPGGHLLVVGNRHLGYHAKLSRLFGSCEVAGSDPRYVVLRAERRRCPPPDPMGADLARRV